MCRQFAKLCLGFAVLFLATSPVARTDAPDNTFMKASGGFTVRPIPDIRPATMESND